MVTVLWIIAALLAFCLWAGLHVVSQLSQIADLIRAFHNEYMKEKTDADKRRYCE